MRPKHAGYRLPHGLFSKHVAPLPHGAFDGKISQRGLTLPTSTIVPFPAFYGQSWNNAPNHRGLGRYVGAQFARPAHGENTRVACDPVLFTIKTMPCFCTTRNYDAAAGGQRLNFSAARMVNPCHRCTIKKHFRTVNHLTWLSARSPFPLGCFKYSKLF